MKLKLQTLFIEEKIKDISFDSRRVKPGDAFFAIRGENFDGNKFIEDALRKGASLVFTDDKSSVLHSGKVVYVQDARMSLAIAAEILYPKNPSNIIAVTGTNGKSSVVSYVHQILSLLGKTSACIGTLGLESNIELIKDFNNIENSYQTTSDPVSFRMVLNTLEESGIANVAFEASSHGIDQKRLGEIKVKSAAFTSFSQDHLEYHKTMENYLQVKLGFFRDNLEKGGEAVINSEILFFDSIKEFLGEHSIRYFSVGKAGDINVTSCKGSIVGQEIAFEFLQKKYKFSTSIIGSFQATNILIAAKLVYNLNIGFDDIVKVLPKLKAVCGRLQRITDPKSDFQVFVDYAHTPDALSQSLSELKKIKPESGKLCVIFGCGGDRDSLKRPIMGKIARNIADYVVITDDNPRTEDATKIRNEIALGMVNSTGDVSLKTEVDIIGDRKEAIVSTIEKLKKGDILLIAGKGHEDYQIIGNSINKFSDIEIATWAFKNAVERGVQ
jgi:UDP-N-acetylmuramoyl-L-alanyl-D-glutamate--2,6-diaminopimelate ligase